MALDDGYVNAEYLRKVAERARDLKQLSYHRMAIQPGNTVLDVGCGPGVDMLALAELAGEGGMVIGIDNDAAMLEEARRTTRQSPYVERIVYRHGSALALPVDDASVDSCRAERLLQVLPAEQEQQVVAELVRVTRAGGYIVLADTDWGSASVDFSDSELERRLLQFFATQMRPHGFAGRRLLALCHDAGLSNLHADTIAMVQTTLDETPFGDWLINSALQAEAIEHHEAQRWIDELQERSAKGNFYSSATMVIVTGQKTGEP